LFVVEPLNVSYGAGISLVVRRTAVFGYTTAGIIHPFSLHVECRGSS